MADTSVKKVESRHSPTGELGQKYLVSGKRVSMRLWEEGPDPGLQERSARTYETVGYVIAGHARLNIEGQTIDLRAGDSWLVPAGAQHTYEIVEPFRALEATAPPARAHGRD